MASSYRDDDPDGYYRAIWTEYIRILGEAGKYDHANALLDRYNTISKKVQYVRRYRRYIVENTNHALVPIEFIDALQEVHHRMEYESESESSESSDDDPDNAAAHGPSRPPPN